MFLKNLKVRKTLKFIKWEFSISSYPYVWMQQMNFLYLCYTCHISVLLHSQRHKFDTIQHNVIMAATINSFIGQVF